MTSLGCKTVSKTSLFFTAVLLALIIAFFVVLMQWAKAVNAPSSSGLKGSAAAATGNNGTRICLLSLIDIEEDEEEKEVYNQEENVIICNPVSGVSDIGVDDAFLTVRNLAIDDILSNREAMRNNEWFIEYSDEWVEKGNHDRSEIITVPEGHSVATVDPSRVSSHGSIDPQHRRVLVSSLKKRRRRLSTTRGQRTVVVVAIDVSMSNTAIYNHVFGKSNSMKSQMHDCSQGEVNIIPHPEFPVINVRPDGDTSDYNFVDLYTNVLKDIKRQLGVRTGRSVTSTTDHLMLIVPDSIDRRPGELGWGATPGFFAGIIESLVPSAMTMLHEIGHNFGLGHAYEDGVAYSDMSTVMGYSHRNVVKMCYNGQNIWDMGWFGNRTYDLKLRDNNYDREVVDLAFYGDYEKTTSNEPVLIRYNDIYLTFNRQRDINLETKEYPDMLLIVREVPGQYHAHTNLERAMEVGSSPFHTSWTKTNPTNGRTSKENIYIEVCSYTAGDAVSPDRLTLAIGRQSGGCPHVSLADGRQSNRGNAVVTNQQPLECRMQWPWVEIANPYYPEDISYLLCDEEVKQNPSQYCEMKDGLSELPVWKICRLECPQTNCATQDNDEGVNEMALVTPSERNVRNSDVDECQNLYSEVKIEVLESDNSPGGVITKSCEDFAVGFLQTRKHYCEKIDITTKLRVGDICKRQCPGNYCSNPANRL